MSVEAVIGWNERVNVDTVVLVKLVVGLMNAGVDVGG